MELLDPNAVHRSQILMGLNMYGFSYTSQGGGHILGRDLVQVRDFFEHCAPEFNDSKLFVIDFSDAVADARESFQSKVST